MQYKRDMDLKHPNWKKVEELLESNGALGLFNRLVDIFILACAIGVKEDKILESGTEEGRSIARNTLNVNSEVSDRLELLYRTAIVTTKYINYTVDERLRIAFDPDSNTDNNLYPTNFLVPYANYGLEKLLSVTTNHDMETIINYMDLINSYDRNIDFIIEEGMEII